MGYEFIGGELAQEGRQVIFRIYIDNANGVSVEDCSRVSHQVSAMMDVEDPIRERYRLEISSPGIDRPLFELKHYSDNIGKRANIKLQLPIHERRQYKGILLRVEGEEICLLVDDLQQEVLLPFSAIKKANIIA